MSDEDNTAKQTNTKPLRFIEQVIVFFSAFFAFAFFPITVCFLFITISQYQRAVIFRLGKLKGGGAAAGPGFIFILPCVDEYEIIDLRTLTLDITPQEVLTSDSCTIHVEAVVFFKIVNPLKAVVNVHDYKESTWMLAATALRNAIGQKILKDILSERETIAGDIQSSLIETTSKWGIYVEKVEIIEIKLPSSMQRAMAAEAEAKRDAKAKVIAADGELEASKQLKQASDIMSQSPVTLQLRYLQTLAAIATEQQSTLIFPIPIDLSRR